MENLIELVPGLDFRAEMEANPDLKEFIHQACNQYTQDFREKLVNDPNKPKLDNSYDNFVVITGTPIINLSKAGWEDKMQKLRSRLANILIKHNIEFTEDQALSDITIPKSEDGSRTQSLAFLNLGNEKRAAKALQVLDKYPMSEKFVFSAIPFSKFEETVKVPLHFEAPRVMSQSELMGWLEDPKDEMVMHYFAGSINVSWFRPENQRRNLEPVLGLNTDLISTNNRQRIERGSLHTFSTQGTYLASKADKHNVSLNGGPHFSCVRNITHFNVDKFQISPNEMQIQTVSMNQNEVIFWDVETGAELRKFEISSYVTPFKWSSDSKFLARGTLSKQQEKDIEAKNQEAAESGMPISLTLAQKLPTQLSVYDSSTMDMLVNPENQKKASIKLPHNIHEFQWNNGPRSEILYYISREIEEEKKASAGLSGFGGPKLNETSNPKTIHVVNINTRKVLLEKMILGAKVSEIHWHPSLDLLAIVKHRHLEKPKEVKIQAPQRGGPKKMPQQEKVSNSIEIYKFKKDTEEGFTLQVGEMLNGFTWHPTLPYFAYLRKQEQQPASQHGYACAAKVVAYYQKPKTFAFQKFQEGSHTQDSYSHIFWAPNSSALVAANAKSMQTASMGKMGFYIYDDKKQLNHIKTQEHEGANKMYWDPSGRYFVSCFMRDDKRSSDEASFRIFNMAGDLIFLKRLPSLGSFQWRPRPRKVLNNEEIATLEKDMPQITKRLQQSYKQLKEQQIEGRKKRKEQKENEFLTYLDDKLKQYAAKKAQREKILGREEEKLDIVLLDFELEEQVINEEFIGIERV